jgi:hypothetical protein
MRRWLRPWLSMWPATPSARELVRSCARVRGGAHGQEVTLANAFSENEEVLMLSKPSLRGAASQMSNV